MTGLTGHLSTGTVENWPKVTRPWISHKPIYCNFYFIYCLLFLRIHVTLHFKILTTKLRRYLTIQWEFPKRNVNFTSRLWRRNETISGGEDNISFKNTAVALGTSLHYKVCGRMALMLLKQINSPTKAQEEGKVTTVKDFTNLLVMEKGSTVWLRKPAKRPTWQYFANIKY